MSYYFQEHSAFAKAKKSPEYPLSIDDEYYSLITETYGTVGKLDGLCRFVPNVDLYIKLLMIQEVCASCKLENIPVQFYDFFGNAECQKDSQLAHNLLRAMEYAQKCTFSESFVKQVHGIITMAGITESKYRNSQGGSFSDLLWSYNAGSNPVPSNWIPTAMKDMQKHIANVSYQNALITAAEIQYKIEVLDPFSKHSRVIARMMSMLILKWGGLLSHPVVWVSDYFLDYKVEYKDRILAAYKQGEEMLAILWIKFFLTAVNASAKKAIHLIETLADDRQEHIAMLPQINSSNKSVLSIYEYIANTVIVNVRQISDSLGLSFSGVSKVVKAFGDAGIVRQVTEKERYRQYGYVPVLDLNKYH